MLLCAYKLYLFSSAIFLLAISLSSALCIATASYSLMLVLSSFISHFAAPFKYNFVLPTLQLLLASSSYTISFSMHTADMTEPAKPLLC